MPTAITTVDTMGNLEKRKFERHPIGIRAYVQSGTDSAPAREDAVWLCDLSGEGALFNASSAAGYAPGQTVGLTICMPGAPGVRAVMRTCGVVIRVMTAPAEKGATPGDVSVALHFTKPLQFQRNGGGAACD